MTERKLGYYTGSQDVEIVTPLFFFPSLALLLSPLFFLSLDPSSAQVYLALNIRGLGLHRKMRCDTLN